MKDLWYLASPYTHPSRAVRQRRIDEAMRACAWFARQGIFVFSPIVHWGPVAMAHELPHDWDFWSGLDETMIQRLTGVQVLMLDGWLESAGVTAEIELCKKLHKPLVYFHPSKLDKLD